MSTSSKFLDEAFKTALSNASTLDQQGTIPQDTEEFFPGGPPTNVQLVQECLDFYNQHHAVMDRAIKGALDLLSTPEGVGDSWVLGYIFQYTESLLPEVGAAWFDKNTGKKLTYNWATASGQSTSCSNTDGSYILITVTF